MIKFNHQKVGLTECPYFERWVLDFGPFAFRVHRWFSSDDDRAHHDHPWWFITFVLWGCYVDESPAGNELMPAGSVRFRPANHQHTVRILKPGTWTFLITGQPSRKWGFWVRDRMVKRDKYFAEHGHHPCSGFEKPVRVRPDGSRI